MNKEEIFNEISSCFKMSVDMNGMKKLEEYITNLQQQCKKQKEENKQLKDLIDTILTFSLFKEECPLNFVFEDNSKEDEAQNIFYSDEYCENNCNSIYKECWLKYFKELQGVDSDE